jgi:hypothetical protein
MVPLFVLGLREKIRIWATLESRRVCDMQRKSQCQIPASEGIVLPIRIIATITLAAAVLGTAVASAAAQIAAEPVGRPLQLLQFVHPNGKAKLPVHHKVAAKLERKPVIAAKAEHKPVVNRHVDRRIARRTIAAPPKAVAAAPQAAPPVTNQAIVETDPNQIAGSGHTVQPASPDQANAVDPAADNHAQTANEQTPNQQAPNTAAASAAPQPATAIVARAVVEKPEPPSPVGSASWIGQVLAALGGAVTAGIVAWFLIWPAPIRTSA